MSLEKAPPENQKKVVVVGAGIIGICSAYYLRMKGFQVTVVEKQDLPAPYGSPSYQNGGLFCWSLTDTWVTPSAKTRLFKSFFSLDSSFKVRFGFHLFDTHLVRWGIRLWRYASEGEELMLRRWRNLYLLSQESLTQYKKLIEKYPQLQTPHRAETLMEVHLSSDRFKSEAHHYDTLRSSIGLPPLMKIETNCAERIKREFPDAEEAYAQQIKGILYSETDTTGDCRQFARALGKISSNLGVEFRFNEEVKQIKHNNDPNNLQITSLVTSKNEYFADYFVFTTGAFTSIFRQLGLDVPVYPIKGFSVEFPIKQTFLEQEQLGTITTPRLIPQVAIGDTNSAIYMARIDDKVRLVGFAEIHGFNDKSNQRRMNQLIAFGKQMMGEQILDWDQPTYHCSHRPLSSDGNPIIGNVSKYNNLYLNVGHGTLGWTLCTGSGSLLAELISGGSGQNVPPPNPFTPNRFKSPLLPW